MTMEFGNTTMTPIEVQSLFGLELTGIYDRHTQAAIKSFQLRNNLPATGLLDPYTHNMIFSWANDNKLYKTEEEIINEKLDIDLDSIEEDISSTTDLSELPLVDIEHEYLSNNQYVSDRGLAVPKEFIFLHHTAGWNDPFQTIKDWEGSKERIATHFVIGGIDIRDKSDDFNGTIVQCIPDEYWAYHLGGTKKHKIDYYMQKHSIGIEICNFGQLTERNGKYYTWTGREVPWNHVCDLGFEFRRYRYWHQYTDNQLSSLKMLLKYIIKEFDINWRNGILDWIESESMKNIFEFKKDARDGKIQGILSHSNVRTDKFDVSPQPNLIQMLIELKDEIDLLV